MAKYRLTVKYNDVCELSLASDIPDIIGSEFDQYVKSMLYKKEEWENFETNFKEAAKLEYGNLGKKAEPENKPEEEVAAPEEEKAEDKSEEAESKTQKDSNVNETDIKLEDVECDISCIDDALDFSENRNVLEKEDEKNITVVVKEPSKKEGANTAKDTKEAKILTFEEYIKNKNINTPLDEFVSGACYLDEIENIKEFSLKQLNAKLYPAFGRLANSETIQNAIERVLIETIKNGLATKYTINQNAWNYHNYDLVRH